MNLKFKDLVHPYRLLCTSLYGFFISVVFFLLYFLAFFMGLIWPLELLVGTIGFSFIIGLILSADDLKYHTDRNIDTIERSKYPAEKTIRSEYELNKARVNHLAV